MSPRGTDRMARQSIWPIKRWRLPRQRIHLAPRALLRTYCSFFAFGAVRPSAPMKRARDVPPPAVEDMDVECKDCKQSFVFTVAEQEFFNERKWPVPRARCRPCTDAKKAKRGDSSAAAAPAAAAGSTAAAVAAPPPAKLTLWINQLPYSATSQDVASHFGVAATAVRLVLRDGKFAGTAFADVPDFEALDRGVALHQSRFECADGSAPRRINVRAAESKETMGKIKESSIAKRGTVLAKAYGAKKHVGKYGDAADAAGKPAKQAKGAPKEASGDGIKARPKETATVGDGKERPKFTPTAGTVCYSCGEVGHMSFDCPTPKPKGKACYSCGQMGHRSIDCPTRFPQSAGKAKGR